MAYINGEFEHPDYEIRIEVLEPAKGENNYKDGMYIQVDWDSFSDMPLSEFRKVLAWMNERSDFIEKNFTKSGKAKTIRTKG